MCLSQVVPNMDKLCRTALFHNPAHYIFSDIRGRARTHFEIGCHSMSSQCRQIRQGPSWFQHVHQPSTLACRCHRTPAEKCTHMVCRGDCCRQHKERCYKDDVALLCSQAAGLVNCVYPEQQPRIYDQVQRLLNWTGHVHNFSN
jgi:hypothetical protein